MGNSAIVGILRALLTANTAEFEQAMKRSAQVAREFSKETRTIGVQATQVGSALTKTLTLPIMAAGGAVAKVAIDFESSFAGVRKTVDATEPEFAALAQGFRNLSKEIPINVNELNRIGEAAGQLGIKKENILGFTEVMAKLGVTTNLSSDQAATSLARLANITQMPQDQFEQLGNIIVHLGNNMATTEAEIVEFGLRIAGAGKQVGLSEGEILGFGAALSSVGINAEAGGTAISKVFIELASRAGEGGKALDEVAKISGMTGAEFKRAFQEDAATATIAFVEGLGRIKDEGGNVFGVIEDLGMSEIRLRDALLRASGAGDLLRNSLQLQADALRENNALSEEARKRFETTASQLTVLWNRVKDVGITLGNALLPTIKNTIGMLDRLIPALDMLARGFAAMPAPVQTGVVAFLGIAAAAGPLIYLFGQLSLSASALAGAFTKKGLATRALQGPLSSLFGILPSGTTAVTLLGRAFAILTGPIGWIVGTTAAIFTATGTWDEFFRILKAGATIVARVATAFVTEFALPLAQGLFTIGKHIVVFIDRITGLSEKLRILGGMFTWVMEKTALFMEALAGSLDAPEKLAKNIAAADARMRKSKEDLVARGLKPAMSAAEAYALVMAKETEQQNRRAEVTKKAEEAAKKHAEAVQALVDRLGGSEAIAAAKLWLEALPRIGGLTKLTADDQLALIKVVDEAVDAYTRMGKEAPPALVSIAAGARQAHLETVRLNSITKETVRSIDAIGTVAPQAFDEFIGSLADLPRLFGGIWEKAPRWQLFGGLGKVMRESLSPTIMQAITGGGNPVAAVGGLIGSQIGNNIASKVGTSMVGKLGSLAGIAGAALGGMATMGISLAAPLVMKGLKKLFGANEEEKIVNPLRDKFYAALGGAEKLNPAIQRATGSLQLMENLLAAKTKEQFAAATKAITDALEGFNQKLIEASELTEEVNGRLEGLTEISPDLQAALEQVYNAETPDAYAAALQNVNAIIDGQTSKTRELDAALQKYGLDWTALGEQARAAKLGEHALELKKDFDLLVGSGVDINTVLAGMKPKLQDFVDQAKKTGTEVPESFRRVIQSAIDSGVLFDANGKKIENIEDLGLKFGQTMEESMKTVASSIERLVQVLEERFASISETVTGEINQIPSEREIIIRGRYVPPDIPNGGYSSPTDGVPHLANGGLVRQPTLAMIGEAGPEVVTPLSQLSQFGMGKQPLVVHSNLYVDGRRFARNTAEHFPDALRDLGMM